MLIYFALITCLTEYTFLGLTRLVIFPPYILLMLHVIFKLSFITCVHCFSPPQSPKFIRAKYSSSPSLYVFLIMPSLMPCT